METDGSIPHCRYTTNESDMVIDNMSIAAADVPYVTAGPNAQYEAQADNGSGLDK